MSILLVSEVSYVFSFFLDPQDKWNTPEVPTISPQPKMIWEKTIMNLYKPIVGQYFIHEAYGEENDLLLIRCPRRYMAVDDVSRTAVGESLSAILRRGGKVSFFFAADVNLWKTPTYKVGLYQL